MRGGDLVAEVRNDAAPAAEVLLPGVDAVLAKAGVALGDVEAFAVSIGPGSFTGLRIGLATVKGLCFGSERPVIPVPTLAALAASAPAGAERAIAILDARRGEIYAGAYRRGVAEALPMLPEGVYTPEELAGRVSGAWVLVGEGVGPCADALRARGRVFDAAQECLPHAADVAALAQRMPAAAGVPAADLVPRYVRRAEAEVKRTGIRFEGA